ncbi:MAG: hypothetical protein K2X99_02005 [Gemmatimonadaceae bacterium]|nr:hypothetical protein [Gemmatimonadaceae bacterium]
MTRHFLLASLALVGAATAAQAQDKKKEEKLSFAAEAEQVPQHARITFTMKKFTPGGVATVMASPYPGTRVPVEYGPYTIDSTGTFKTSLKVPCTTAMRDETMIMVTFFAVDSASSRTSQKIRVDGGPWLCQ